VFSEKEEKAEYADKRRKSIRFDAFPGEKGLLPFRLADGFGLLTTHRLILEREKHNPRLKIMELQQQGLSVGKV